MNETFPKVSNNLIFHRKEQGLCAVSLKCSGEAAVLQSCEGLEVKYLTDWNWQKKM